MKIAHITDYFNENLVYQENLLTVGQKELGHEVVVITSNLLIEIPITKGNRKTKVGSFLFKGVKIIRCPYIIEVKKNSLLFFSNVFASLCSEKPDYIFIHDKGLYMFSILAYKIFVKPSVILRMDFHSDYSNSLNSKFGKVYHKLFMIFFKLFGGLFDKYYYIAPEMGIFVHEMYLLPKNKTYLLRLPGDEGKTSKVTIGALRQKWNLEQDETYLLHTGKLPEGKKTIELIEAVEEQNLNLVICGSINDSNEGTVLKDKILNSTNVIYLGWVDADDLRELIKCCDVLVQPGSLSNTFIEAVCIGTPLILADSLQANDLINNENGIIIGNDASIVDIKEAISKFLNNKDFYLENAFKMKYRFNYINIAKQSLLK